MRDSGTGGECFYYLFIMATRPSGFIIYSWVGGIWYISSIEKEKTRKSVSGQARAARKAPRLYGGKNDGRAPPDPPLCPRPRFPRLKTTQLPWRPGETVLSLKAISLKNNGLCHAGVGLWARMSRIIEPQLPVAVFFRGPTLHDDFSGWPACRFLCRRSTENLAESSWISSRSSSSVLVSPIV